MRVTRRGPLLLIALLDTLLIGSVYVQLFAMLQLETNHPWEYSVIYDTADTPLIC